MLVVKDQKMSSYKDEYNVIKNEVVTLWLNNIPAGNEMNASIALYEMASEIYGRMYHTDNILNCKAEDVQEEYNHLVEFLRELKKYHGNTGDWQVCITCLENCLKQIPVITGTEFLTDPEHLDPLNASDKQSAFSLIVAECSFKMLNEIFYELLGDSTEER